MTTEQEEGMALPDNLAGPFLRERAVQGRGYRHYSAQVASVLYYQDGGHSVITARGADHRDRLSRWSRPTTVCEVACGRHTTTFTLKLPAHGAATFFDTRVTLRWEVVDHRLVVEKRLFSVENDLGPEIVNRLQGVTARYSVDQAHEANQAVQRDIEAGRWAGLGREVGLRTDVFVEVGTDRTQIAFVNRTRRDEAEMQRVTARYRGFAAIAHGTDAEKYAYLMASGDSAEVGRLVKMMLESQAEDQRANREFLIRMAHEGRINTPELDAYIRRLVLPGEGTGQLPSPGPEPRTALPPPPVAQAPAASAGSSGPDWPDDPAGDTGVHDTPGRGTARPPAGPPRQEEDDWWGEPQDIVGHPTGAPAATDGYGASGLADGHGYEYAQAESSGPGADHAESGAGQGSRAASRGGGHEDDDIWGDPTEGRTGGRDGGR
ncbi:hypothetical protein [Streptomyces sp. I5]|uniref:hypothetical protein n=1 Tax=Streptomyces sp. I5 TaxID=2759947 RepID=UPI0018EEC676|nr:hypothetical protein [Streptomyces sp. I5]MBJ6635273.1 hypothetical protein [Streptomyces sp. I5]